MQRTEAINLIALYIGAKSYLEIGIYSPARNFDKIQVPSKVGIDPRIDDEDRNIKPTASDDFFDELDKDMKFDLIFVDGDHRYAQCKRDVKNAQKALAPGGVIVMHDVNPARVEMTGDHKPERGVAWCGEAWTVFLEFRRHKKWCACCIPDDHGIGILFRGDNPDPLTAKLPIEWTDFTANRGQILNVIEGTKAGLKAVIDSRKKAPEDVASAEDYPGN